MSAQPGDDGLRIEIVFATSERQFLETLIVAPGTSIAVAIEKSNVTAAFPEIDLASLAVGVWGNVASRSVVVRDGDRIELYRPLPADPRDARRQVASTGGFMGQHRTSDDD